MYTFDHHNILLGCWQGLQGLDSNARLRYDWPLLGSSQPQLACPAPSAQCGELELAHTRPCTIALALALALALVLPLLSLCSRDVTLAVTCNCDCPPNMIVRKLSVAVLPSVRARCLAPTSVVRRTLHTRGPRRSAYHRSDFGGQGFSSFYESDQPTRGPLAGASNIGGSSVTPKSLREHLDQFVVDQDRAKVVLSVAVHEHYLRIQELRRQRDKQAKLEAQAQRRASAFRHPVEGRQTQVSLHSQKVLLLSKDRD